MWLYLLLKNITQKRSEMNLSKLVKVIDNAIEEKGMEPSVIVMHPDTWGLLIEEVTGKKIETFSPLSFKGIRVYRSEDVKKGDFKM